MRKKSNEQLQSPGFDITATSVSGVSGFKKLMN
jgi:hypothetical protein